MEGVELVVALYVDFEIFGIFLNYELDCSHCKQLILGQQ